VVAASSTGDMAIADTGNLRIRIVAARTGSFFGQNMTAGDIYTIAGTGHPGYSGDNGPGREARIGLNVGLAFDSAGNVLVADQYNNVVRVVAVRSGTFYGQVMKAGDIYTIAGTGTSGYSGDGGPAIDAQLADAASVTVDQNGNVVVGDGGAIRVIAASSGTFYGQAMVAGDIYTVATLGELVNAGLAIDSAGNIIAASDEYSVYAVAETSGTFYGQAMTAGSSYLIAGGEGAYRREINDVLATSVVVAPSAIAVDAAGNVILTDWNDDRVRVVARNSGTFYGIAMTAGYIYTIAGGGHAGLGDGGPAVDATLQPTGVAVEPSGDILVASQDRIRELSS
jgi:hypothetical protein